MDGASVALHVHAGSFSEKAWPSWAYRLFTKAGQNADRSSASASMMNSVLPVSASD